MNYASRTGASAFFNALLRRIAAVRAALVFAAVGEAATGLALLIVPSLVGQLLLGQELAGVAVAVARVAGIALIGLGVAYSFPGPPASRHIDLQRGCRLVPRLPRSGGCGERHPAVAGRRRSHRSCRVYFGRRAKSKVNQKSATARPPACSAGLNASAVVYLKAPAASTDIASLRETYERIMPTTREIILQALHALLQTQPAPVLRGEVLPERVPAAGLLILRDGDPGEPAVTLSPLCYHYQHRAQVEAVVQAGTGRDAAFDALAAGVGIVLSADRTLGGLCDWVEAEAPRPVDLAVDGAATLKAAVIPVVLHYSTSDPLA